jgi:hypothetical protein
MRLSYRGAVKSEAPERKAAQGYRETSVKGKKTMSKKIEKETLDLREKLGDAALSHLERKIADALSKPAHIQDGKSALAYRQYSREELTFDQFAGIVALDVYGEHDPELVADALKSVVDKVGSAEDLLTEECPVCKRAEIDAPSIDADLLTIGESDGESYWTLERRYGISSRALAQHKADHLMPDIRQFVGRRYERIPA